MWGWISNIGSLAGIIGVSFTNWVSDPVKGWIALAAFLLLLGFAAWRIYSVTNQVFKRKYVDGYMPLSSAAKWTTTDGKNISYELTRHIQVKSPYMKCFDHTFVWTGSKLPQVSSVLQKISDITDLPGEKRKLVKLTFPQTRMYNEVEIVHLKMVLDDSDRAAETFLAQAVKNPIRLITFQVELLHTDERYVGQLASVTREELDKGATAISEPITKVPFDLTTKSFSYQLLNPEPGYRYKISWDQPEIAPKPTNRAQNKSSRKKPAVPA